MKESVQFYCIAHSRALIGHLGEASRKNNWRKLLKSELFTKGKCPS